MNRFDGRVALVTGGSSGIGAAVAERLLREGAKVATLDLEQKTLRSATILEPVALPEGARARFLEGTWDDTFVLLEAGEKIERVASRLPYLNGWAAEQQSR